MALATRSQRAPNMGIPPNQTLYINNLNEKVKIPELKASLFELFSTYGEMMDIVASSSLKRKGQAFVVFRDIAAATQALRALSSFKFYDRPMRIEYAKDKSDAVAKEEGTFKPRLRSKKAEEDLTKDAKPKTKQGPSFKDVGKVNLDNPNSTLFVENLPGDMNEMMLTMLFRQYSGFQEVRLISGRNVAFVEYGEEPQATIALQGLQGFLATPENPLRISYANKK